MEPQVLRTSDVLAATGLSRTTLWRRVKSGEFPAPIRLGGTKSRAVGWRRTEIDVWIDQRSRAASAPRTEPDDLGIAELHVSKHHSAPTETADAPSPRAEGTKRSASVTIEPDLFEAFDSWRSETGRSFADYVLSAHLEHGARAVARLHLQHDPVRAAHGLPQLRRQLEPGKTLTMWILRESLDELDAAARSVDMSRRAYIDALLRVALRDKTPRY